MTAAMNRIERSPVLMTARDDAGASSKSLRHETAQTLGVLAVIAFTAVAIVGLRLLAYGLRREHLPFFREFNRLWN